MSCHNQSKDWYLVTLSTLGLVCSCPGNMGGKMACKHIFAVDAIISKAHKITGRAITIKRKMIRCHHCKSKNFTKYGKRKCKQKDEQRYKCSRCGKTFSGMDGFRGRHHSALVIVMALSLVAAVVPV